jgi:hypothetical protein
LITVCKSLSVSNLLGKGISLWSNSQLVEFVAAMQASIRNSWSLWLGSFWSEQLQNLQIRWKDYQASN